MTTRQKYINKFNESGCIFETVEEQLIEESVDAKHLGDGIVYLFADNSILRTNPSSLDYTYY